MYHIFAPKCHGQDSAIQGEYHPPDLASAHTPGLIELAAAVLAGVGGVDQQRDLARAGGIVDLVGAVDEVAGPGFHAEAVERGLPERLLGPFTEIGGDSEVVRLEGAAQRCLELSLGVGVVELGASDADPGAAAWRPRANVGRDGPIGSEREPDQLVAIALAAGEGASALPGGPFPVCAGS